MHCSKERLYSITSSASASSLSGTIRPSALAVLTLMASAGELAQRASLSLPTVQKIENALDGKRGSRASIEALERALSVAGVAWCDNLEEDGAWLRKAH